MISSKSLTNLKAGIIVLFILSYLVKAFFPMEFFPYFMGILVVLFFCISFGDLKPLNRYLIVVLMICSGFFIWLGPDGFHWSQAIIENAGFVTLVLTVPMLGTILYFAPYETVLLSFASRFIKTSFVYYVIVMGLVAFLCSLMSLAAVPFIYQLLKPIAGKYPEELLYKALTRGFVINLFWAPNLVSVAIVMQFVHVSWQNLAMVGVGFSVLVFAAACVLGKYEILHYEQSPVFIKNDEDTTDDVVTDPDGNRYMLLLLVQVGLILTTVVGLTHFAHTSNFVTVGIIALILPLVIAAPLGKTEIYRQRLDYYLFNILPGMGNEFMLFLTIGFFGYALGKLPAIALLQTQMGIFVQYGADLLALSIIIVIGAAAMIGVHPIITISLIAIALGKINTGLSDMQLAIALITGYIIYLLLSPISTMVMITSGLSGKNVYKMGLKLNGRYALILTVLILGVLHIWHN